MFESEISDWSATFYLCLKRIHVFPSMSDKPASETPASSSGGYNKRKIIYIALGVIVAAVVVVIIVMSLKPGGSGLSSSHASDLSKTGSHPESSKESSNSLHGGKVSFLKSDAGKSDLPHSAFNF